MLDIKFVRNNQKEVLEILKNHTKEGVNANLLDKFNKIDALWKKASTRLQELNTIRNSKSDQISQLMKAGKKSEVEQIKKEVLDMKKEIEDLNQKTSEYEKELKSIMFQIPNKLDKKVPIGDEDVYKVITEVKPKKMDFTPLSHRDLAIKNNLIDFERGTKLSGSRGYILTGFGAKLLRALRNFTLDLAVNDGYVETLQPTLIKEELLYGLGKIPFFQEDMYQTDDKLYLTATEEFPITAMYANEVLDINKLPIKVTSSNCNWRKEAGSAGKDVGGILRVHYFYNTELINFTTQEDSEKALELMVKQAEKVLKLLQIPYRIILLPSSDTGAASSITYDLEVWVPSENKYREISSCSNCLDYQSRGLNIKYKDKNGELKYVHTLNGTGVSLNRLWIAIIENCQTKNGLEFNFPEVLKKYL